MDIKDYEIIKEIHETGENGNHATYHILEKKSDRLTRIRMVAMILGIIVVSGSIGYYFVYRPIQKERILKECDRQTGGFNAFRKEKWQAEFDKCLHERGL